MRHLALLIFVLQLQTVIAQDSVKVKHEFGCKLFSLTLPTHIYYPIADHPYYQFTNGVFYRASKNRSAFRATINYAEHQTSSFFRSNDLTSNDVSGSASNQDFKVSIGGQYDLFKKQDLFYCFADFYYRNLCSKGNFYGGFPPTDARFFAKSDQAGTNAGLGLKLKVYKSLYISPELFCDLFYSETMFDIYYNVTSRFYGSSSETENHSFYSQTKLRPAARIFLTVAF